MGSHALQETLRRVDRAFQGFFRRCKAGRTPGFPRFKGFNRFDSFSYPDPAGWSYLPFPDDDYKGKNNRTGILRVGDLLLRVRGMGRFRGFTPNDLTLKRVSKAVTRASGVVVKPAVWEATVTLRVTAVDCARERSGNAVRGFDQGLKDRLTFDDGETVVNSRLLRSKLADLAELQRLSANCRKGSR